jgi:DNA-binding GntR family transcriptional regulator
MTASPSPLITHRRRNLARDIVGWLRDEIISGQLPPGEPLAEIALSERFQTSRAPVREALIELEREGLVQFGATGRTRVRTLAPKDFDEIMETRVALESMGARRAAGNWTDEDTAWVEANLGAQSQASTLTELSGLDVEMHAYILRRSGNQRLLGLWQSVRWQFEMCLAYSHRLQQKLSFDARGLTVESHRRLLVGIASRRPEVAARAMANHIEEWTEWWAAEFAHTESKPATPRES